MRKAQRWRYYCDFCRKAGGSSHHLQRHERGCTANPNRVCGFCDSNTPVAERVAILTAESGFKGLAKWQANMLLLREAVDQCPACILATIRQASIPMYDEDDGIETPCPTYWKDVTGVDAMFGFDFKEEKRLWWVDHPRGGDDR
jgi:hypothetical protein